MKKAFVFDAHFRDQTRVVIVIDVAFGTPEAARTEAMRYMHPLGKLPTPLRKGIDNSLVVHMGGENTTAFSDHGLIIVYSDNATKRIGTHDLEETIFHESVHASWDGEHARSPEWAAAQARDGVFITKYGERKPQNEDLAESALFAYTLLHHPERIPAEEGTRIREMIPNRIAYIAKLLPPGESIFVDVEALAAKPEGQAQPKPDAPAAAGDCPGNIALRGILADVLSNALRIDFNISTSAPSWSRSAAIRATRGAKTCSRRSWRNTALTPRSSRRAFGAISTPTARTDRWTTPRRTRHWRNGRRSQGEAKNRNTREPWARGCPIYIIGVGGFEPPTF